MELSLELCRGAGLSIVPRHGLVPGPALGLGIGIGPDLGLGAALGTGLRPDPGGEKDEACNGREELGSQ